MDRFKQDACGRPQQEGADEGLEEGRRLALQRHHLRATALGHPLAPVAPIPSCSQPAPAPRAPAPRRPRPPRRAPGAPPPGPGPAAAAGPHRGLAGLRAARGMAARGGGGRARRRRASGAAGARAWHPAPGSGGRPGSGSRTPGPRGRPAAGCGVPWGGGGRGGGSREAQECRAGAGGPISGRAAPCVAGRGPESRPRGPAPQYFRRIVLEPYARPEARPPSTSGPTVLGLPAPESESGLTQAGTHPRPPAVLAPSAQYFRS